jgi:hypothetical protein
LDLLIVGGGPCGTAAAWRAHELGLSVMVVDRDCVLAILKEWGEHQPNPKKVDAEYGDCADLPFPAGGALIAQFPYEDQTPANQIYERWLKVYDDNHIPYRNGVELGGCEELGGGVIAAECMELQTQAKTKVYSKSVVLALGSGSPAKVRVMGDGLGISRRSSSETSRTKRETCKRQKKSCSRRSSFRAMKRKRWNSRPASYARTHGLPERGVTFPGPSASCDERRSFRPRMLKLRQSWVTCFCAARLLLRRLAGQLTRSHSIPTIQLPCFYPLASLRRRGKRTKLVNSMR